MPHADALSSAPPAPGPALEGTVRLEAITLDFGNTLVPVEHAAMRRVVGDTARLICERCGPFAEEEFLAVWSEERERQFAEEVPAFREVELPQRLVRVLARLRGYSAPGRERRWDDGAAATWSEQSEVAWGVEVYSDAFVRLIPVPAEVGPLLERLAARARIAILSNWPLARTVDRFVEAAGWNRWLSATVVSERVGTIKPHPDIFRIAAETLQLPPERILHVGDDWAADVVGAKAAGWRAAYLRTAEGASPLPSSERDGRVRADIELGSLAELEPAIDREGWW